MDWTHLNFSQQGKTWSSFESTRAAFAGRWLDCQNFCAAKILHSFSFRGNFHAFLRVFAVIGATSIKHLFQCTQNLHCSLSYSNQTCSGHRSQQRLTKFNVEGLGFWLKKFKRSDEVSVHNRASNLATRLWSRHPEPHSVQRDSLSR